MAAPLPVPDTRALNMQRRRERILQAARGLIGSLGFSGLTLRELAEAAGVTVPTIYNLIGNKDQLLRELNEEMMSHLESRLASRPSEPALQRFCSGAASGGGWAGQAPAAALPGGRGGAVQGPPAPPAGAPASLRKAGRRPCLA